MKRHQYPPLILMFPKGFSVAIQVVTQKIYLG